MRLHFSGARRLVVIVACMAGVLSACQPDRPRGRTRDAAAVVQSGATSAIAVTSPQSSWMRQADSALDRSVALQLFSMDGGYAPDFRECEGDEGTESAPPLFAAGRVRVLHEIAPILTVSPTGFASRDAALFAVEVTSAARFEPAPDGEPEHYLVRVGVRVDTLRQHVEDAHGRDARWAVCMPMLAGADSTLGTQWGFAHARDPWMTTVGWEPRDATWESIIQLADSIRAATPAPHSLASPAARASSSPTSARPK